MERRLAAIMATDVVGYSRLIRADEEGTLAALKGLRADFINPKIAKHHGRIVKLMGDGMLVEFASVVDAVRAALEVQGSLADHDQGVPEESRIAFRVGINLGDVVIDGDDIQGDGVNVAARLEGLAEPGGICVSGGVHDQVRDRIDVAFEDLGEREVKNIDRPVHVWRGLAGGPAAGPGAPSTPTLPEKPSIAVLPFDNMSGDTEQGYFADGITDDIVTDLSKVSGLFVIARNSSFAYKGKSMDVREVCRDLGVRYVLEGSVRKAGERVRINAQMIDGATGGHLWAERYDRDLADIFAVQDEVTREIVGALRVALTADEEGRRAGRRKVDPEAYDLLVRARTRMFVFTPEALVERRALLERAIEIDPELAAAHALLSSANITEYLNGWNDAGPDNLASALEIAERACDIDPAEPQAFHALALANLWIGNFDAAAHAAERAVELNPNFAGGYSALGQVRDFAGDHASAVECAERVLKLDPHYSIALQLLGRAQFALGRDLEAAANFEERIVRNPDTDTARAFLAAIHGHAGRHDEARRRWDELKEINPNYSVERVRQTLPYKDPAPLDRLAEGLRKAGLAE